MNLILQAYKVSKIYNQGKFSYRILQDIYLSLYSGEKIAIIGASGSGKSTLLHLLAGLDNISSGSIYFSGINLNNISQKTLNQLRNEKLGFIHQHHHLLAEFSALDNIAMPLKIRGLRKKIAQNKAFQLLEKMELSHRAHYRPNALSGGERQRIAIGRALITQPLCILADEPTGNLDINSANIVFDLMMQLTKEINTALIIVTHDAMRAVHCDRVLKLQNGTLFDI